MATYTKRTRKKGTVWRAQIRICRQDGTVHNESKSFSNKARAQKWAKDREQELEDPKATRKAADSNTPLQKILLDYIEEVGDDFGRTKRKSLEQIATFELAENPVGQLSTDKMLAHLRDRRKIVTSATAATDLIWIKSALTHAKDAWGMEIDINFLEDARRSAHRARLIGKAKERDRRPTSEELQRLREWFNRPPRNSGVRKHIPMADIMDFAIASARRQSEITRLRWKDLDQKKGICLLRDAKNPKGSKGNHRTFALTKEALAIIDRQPRTSEYIFPYNTISVRTAFRRVCEHLGIKDLTFHDLRHEAASRLFEAGFQIHEVQQFTLHESWATLQRYTQLNPEDVANR